MALSLVSCFASGNTEKHGPYQVCCAWHGGLRQKQVTQTWIVCLIKKHFLTLILDCKRPNIVKLVTKPREVLCVFDWCDHSLDCEEGCQVCRVRGDNNEGEEPPDTPHDTCGSSFGVQTGTLKRKTR